MGICWYCHWGWAEPVAALYAEALADFNGDDSALHFGPSHIVFEDDNFEDHHVDSCITLCDDVAFYAERFSVEDLEKCRKWLLKLKEIPEEIRCCEPDNYDGAHPEQFPPPVAVRMTKVF